MRSMTSLASGSKAASPTATPMSEMHSIALPRSMRNCLPPATCRICLSPGMKEP